MRSANDPRRTAHGVDPQILVREARRWQTGSVDLPSALITPFTIAATLGSGIVAGVFLSFSSFMVRTLRELAPAEGMRVMQSVNRTIVRSPFVLAFISTALLAATLVIFTAVTASAETLWIIAAAVTYIVGAVVVTGVFNVPRNNALDGADPSSAAGQALWQEYLRVWVRYNHVRTIAACASTVFFALALATRTIV